MSILSHASILASGPYRNLEIRAGEAGVAQMLLRFMRRLRMCEEELTAEYHPADQMRCPVHFCIGQEAVPAALSLLLMHDDYLFCHHRSHGYYLAKHAPMDSLFAEIYGKSCGANGGLAGSQDISSPSHNFFSGAILTGATAIAMGAALGLQLQKRPNVAIAGFGESATDEGIFWETVNYAALAKLPVVFVCENNRYSVFSPQSKRSALDNLAERVRSFGMRSTSLFGNDAMEVHRTLAREIGLARSGQGPAFVEAYTYRWSGHYGPASDDLVGYRDATEIEFWKQNCPISLLEKAIKESGSYDEAGRQEWEREIRDEIRRSFEVAKTGPFPAISEWAILNSSSLSPLADRLLCSVERSAFDGKQEAEQAKGY